MTKLITKELERTFEKYPFGSQRDKGLDALVIASYYNPCGDERWLITEAKKLRNGDWLLLGYLRVPNLKSRKWFWGRVFLSELENYDVPFGMTINRTFDLFEKTINEHIKREDYYL